MTDDAQSNSQGPDDFLNAWWSKYCPECRRRRPMSETHCPGDGTALRDLSISTYWPEETAWLTSSASAHLGAGEAASADSPPCPECGAPVPLEETVCPHCGTPPLGSDLPAAWLSHGVPEVLGGKWRLESLRAGGAFGAFFVGRHAILGMQVGIKVLRSRFTSSEAGRSMFHEEAMRLSRLNHPNIVKVLDYGEEDGRPFLVMEYLQGKPLSHYLAKGTLNLEEKVEVVRQAAVALMAAHSGEGIGGPLVHLDLKPEHVFLEKIKGRWHVKVIDFGIAEIASAPAGDASSPGCGSGKRRLAGTYPYMAPERWRGEVNPGCDIYSLGVISFELVAGQKPFQAKHHEEWRRKHEREKPPLPSSFRHSRRTALLRELDAIINSCLRKKPEERPQSAEVLVEALERWQARPRRTRTQRLLRAAAVPLCITMLAAGIFYWGPWEEIVVSSVPPVLGPSKPSVALGATVSGIGYEAGEATLEVRSGETCGHLPLGRVTGKKLTVDVTCQQIADALGTPLDGGEIEARILVRGSLGRSVASRSFTLRLDNKPPEFEVVKPAVEENGTLFVKGKNFHVKADEALDAGNCFLWSGTEKYLPRFSSNGEDDHELEFPVPDGTTQVSLEVVDRAGNTATRPWTVRSIVVPEVSSAREVFTNDPVFSLPFDLDSTPYQLQVRVEGEDPEPRGISIEEGQRRFQCPLTFEGGESRVQTRRVHVLTSSEIAAKKREPAEGESLITVNYFRRKLSVKLKKTDEDTGLPLQFRLFDEANSIVTDLESWNLTLILDDGKQKGAVRASISSAGDLDMKLLKGLEGNLTLILQGRDRYGNQSDVWLHDYAIGVDPPNISLRIDGPERNERSPLHHRDCRCREGGKSTKSLHLTADVKYRVLQNLEYEFRLFDPSGGPLLENVVRDGEFGFTIPENALLGLQLEEGSNDLFLVARDSQTDVTGDGKCTFYYDKKLSVDITPEAKEPRSEDSLRVTVQASGPRVKAVTIAGKEAPQDGGGTGPFVRDLEVKPEGETVVAITVQLENGCIKEEALRYYRSPVSGHPYGFATGGELGELVVAFQSHGKYAEEDFWFTPLEDWPKLLERFQNSLTGHKFYQDPENQQRLSRQGEPKSGVSWQEAEAVAGWLTQELRDAGKLGRDQAVDLPQWNQVRAIHETACTSTGEAGAKEYEWLSSKEQLPPFKAVFVRTTADGDPERLGAHDWQESHAGFRLCIPASGNENQFSARTAHVVNGGLAASKGGEKAR